LYLPVSEHIDIYCEGGGYLYCPKSKNVKMMSAANEPALKERRCSRRRPVRLFARISERLQDLEHVGAEGAAITVDLSREGLRVELCKPLAEGTEISFSLEDASSRSPVHGSGMVQWCRSIENGSLFHAGIMLTDQAISHEIQLCAAGIAE
jgi:hypothetical protein